MHAWNFGYTAVATPLTLDRSRRRGRTWGWCSQLSCPHIPEGGFTLFSGSMVMGEIFLYSNRTWTYSKAISCPPFTPWQAGFWPDTLLQGSATPPSPAVRAPPCPGDPCGPSTAAFPPSWNGLLWWPQTRLGFSSHLWPLPDSCSAERRSFAALFPSELIRWDASFTPSSFSERSEADGSFLPPGCL